jgi:predicted LPLAT superfamily acyltransferase/glycosyltransferase involved in cell wall biosynthesis
MTPEIIIAIPVFNNPQTILAVVEDCISKCQLPILVVDDGSTTPVSDVLKSCSAHIQSGRLRILRLETNRGKGAALKLALHYCIEQGFTHCLTMDGDGQHLATEIINLERAAWKHPWDVIIGKREFSGDHVPSISKFGRKFSNFWVWYETDQKVEDSQSGMRVYPIFHLQNAHFLTNRYDFEIESLTRAVWNGAGITEVPIKVHYPEESKRVSHFHKFKDNVRISILNVVLVTISLFKKHLTPKKSSVALAAGFIAGFFTGNILNGFLFLIPVAVIGRLNGWLLLTSMIVFATSARLGWFTSLSTTLAVQDWTIALAIGAALYIMTWHALTILEAKSKAPWTAKMRGGRFGAFFMQQVSRRLGLAATYVCLLFIAPYFYFAAPKGKKASLEYLRYVFPDDGPIKRRLKVVKHFHSFGKILLDRLFQSQAKNSMFKLNITGRQHVADAFESGKGAILLSAHVGGWDISTRAMLLEYMKEKLAVAEFKIDDPMNADQTTRKGDELIQNNIKVNDGQVPILQYRNMLDAGQIVGIMADRPLTDKLALVKFLGKFVPFDVTPFRIAASCNAPVIFCFAFKTGFKSYDFVVDAPRLYQFTPGADKDALARSWVQEFAIRLEKEVKKHPYQWLNFFPIFSTAPRRI